MFWDTQAMMKARDFAEKNVGPNGQYLHGTDPKLMNVSLYTKNAGRFWYGDLDIYSDTDGLQKIANGLKEPVSIIPEWDLTDLRSIEKRAITKFKPGGERS